MLYLIFTNLQNLHERIGTQIGKEYITYLPVCSMPPPAANNTKLSGTKISKLEKLIFLFICVFAKKFKTYGEIANNKGIKAFDNQAFDVNIPNILLKPLVNIVL